MTGSRAWSATRPCSPTRLSSRGGSRGSNNNRGSSSGGNEALGRGDLRRGNEKEGWIGADGKDAGLVVCLFILLRRRAQPRAGQGGHFALYSSLSFPLRSRRCTLARTSHPLILPLHFPRPAALSFKRTASRALVIIAELSRPAKHKRTVHSTADCNMEVTDEKHAPVRSRVRTRPSVCERLMSRKHRRVLRVRARQK